MVLIKPCLCEAGGVFAVIVMLKDDGVGSEGMVLKCTQEGLLKKGTVLGCIEDAMDPVKPSNSCCSDAVTARAHSSANVGAKSVNGRAGGARARVMINVGKRARAKMQIL